MKNEGMRRFVVLWFGQLVSWAGTAMTRFALLIWAYEQTESAMTVALLGFFAFVPFVLISPIAGVWVDRLDRRKIMLAGDMGAGVVTMGLLALYLTGGLEIWHLYLAEALSGAFEAFQIPAYTAATTTLLPKAQYARASGLRSMAQSTAQIVAPMLGGLVLITFGITGVLVIDIATFVVALLTLALIRIPAAPVEEEEAETTSARRFITELRKGLQFLWRRPGLLGLVGIFTGINFFAALTWFAIMPAMILARSGGDELALASVQGALGAAGLAGGVVVSLWGGPKRKIHGALGMTAISFILGDGLFALGRGVVAWIVAASLGAFFIPILVASNQAIWQTKVPPALQGRIFSVVLMLRQSMTPFGYLLGGLVAERWLEPAMMPGGRLVPLFGGLVGSGPGAGMAVMFLGTAVLGCAMSLSGYLFPAIRNVEEALPDFDEAAPPTTVVPASLGS
ncbi:MAG: MFS transporter [Ardenticatenaceae bacterium]